VTNANPIDKRQIGVIYTFLNVDGKPASSLHHGPPSSFTEGARLQLIGQPDLTVGRPDAAFQFLTLVGGATDITGIYMRHVFLRNVEVHYSGGPLHLDDVTFIDCKFVFDNTENARRLAQAILSIQRVTFSV
jgi:hypothetical protein